MPRIRSLLPLLLCAGCYDFDSLVGPPADGAADLAAGIPFDLVAGDAPAATDLAADTDAPLPPPADLTPIDQAPAGDLSQAPDLAVPDLLAPPDLTARADIGRPPDLAIRSDIAAPPDLVLVCPPAFTNCDGDPGNGCESEMSLDPLNCGACGHACGAGQTCWNSACIAQVPVLYLHADYASFAKDVQAKLLATGAFSVVDTYDAQVNAPPVQTLAKYDAVLVSSNYPYKDHVTLGDNLATYFDNGGRVVVAVFADANGNAGYSPRGRFANGYALLAPFTYDEPPPADQLGNLLEPQSPLLLGVRQFAATRAYRSNAAPVNGSTVVATWQSGKPLVVRGQVKGRTRVDLNFFPTSADGQIQPADKNGRWVGDGAALLRNALLMR